MPPPPLPEYHPPLPSRWFTAVRQSGLLSSLSPEAWHALSALLSFRTPDGRCPFRLEHLAFSLGCSPEEALARLQTLSQALWQEQPLVALEQGPDGEVVGAALAPLDLLLPAPDLPEAQTIQEEGSVSLLVPTSVPPPAQPTPLPRSHPPADWADDLVSRLEALGLYPDQVDRLLSEYPEERVRRQLEWLPARRARVPAALLIRAVEGDWAAPKASKSTKESE